MDSFWDFFWLMLWAFFIVIWIMILWQIFTDLFRDHETGGFAKAMWVIFLIFFTPITALIYLIAKGKGMAERNMKAAQRMQEQQAEYIRSVSVGSDPAEQIAKAKGLLDSGAITQAEFDSIKTKALA
jgi:hypothetical protein